MNTVIACDRIGPAEKGVVFIRKQMQIKLDDYGHMVVNCMSSPLSNVASCYLYGVTLTAYITSAALYDTGDSAKLD